jgi:uncharacterized OsmC-like protein
MIGHDGRYEVSGRILQPGLAEVTCNQSVIAFDSSPTQGTALPGPAELFAGAFAACLLKNVERFSEILRFNQSGASVDVVLERNESPPLFARLQYELRVATDEPPWRVALLHRNLRKFGTVYNTIAEACDVTGNLVIAPYEATPGGTTSERASEGTEVAPGSANR